MTEIQAIVLGIVQGATEFLPVSSSGHLILVPTLLGWDLQGLEFDVALHIGTALAVLLFFWKDWWMMLLSLFADIKEVLVRKNPAWGTLRRETRMLLTIGIVSIPVAVAGIILESPIESYFRSPVFVAAMMILVAFILWFADKYAAKSAELKITKVTEIPFMKALIISISQVLALFPGTSRSGISISTGLFVGLTREQAARFSFLLATPIILGAGIIKLPDLLIADAAIMKEVIIGFLASFITGIIAVKWLIDYLKHRTLMVFVWYRILLGLIILYVHFLVR